MNSSFVVDPSVARAERVLVFTSSGGTAHDAAAYALRDWIARWDSSVTVNVEHVMEQASRVTRGGTRLYNWIQKYGPWMHQVYWRLMEFEQLTKPGTLLFGRGYVRSLLERLKPDVVISTHPHTNLGHFDLVKQVLGADVRCITCCTELDGGFGFSRNWVSKRADLFWAITEEVAREACRRGLPQERVRVLGPLLYPDFKPALSLGSTQRRLPLLVLGTGANGANNHLAFLQALLPLAGRVRVLALCGKRPAALGQVRQWAADHPQLDVEARGFLGPQAMAELYRDAWAMVARPGARTATEALLSGCVLMFNISSTTMPQELLARRYFRARQLEVVINTPSQLHRQVREWLDEPVRYHNLRERYRRSGLQQHPERISAFLGLAT